MKLHVMFRGKHRGDCGPSYPTMLIEISNVSFSKMTRLQENEKIKNYYIVSKRNAIYDKNDEPLHLGNLMFKAQTLFLSEELRIRVV